MYHNILEKDRNKVSVFDCALQILHDGCPFHRKAYLCDQQEDYDDGMCERCWTNYLFDVANGLDNKKYGECQ